ncbi:bifunctional aminotransferase class I/II-fold pyridoxal phosphate-dependent enzyme/GNAT family N-acetyltransferase [Salegentibacter sp. LM13S]|uniref:bifunctional aminotransferase class I/II-fold pyridoxal phosphate-dependent enzyme/GNAT family N-acetyltransferase n=1 Tax=Salegentibacter lacus TaxID=2873599 RepID=UPI001CCE6555|nr:bifunctional aminotransferase class I/II-fold pyridoxal phosphate-dependent enzyme/GNAT family N-acetyltransferase [Salegentibacter lacus]MBZ9629764.1 bifunctional aminotransferase class I/II-fold pyridoxal phosphate-dependent enzyme/GNAT family N-acetyltransferase [Salegentibacter lacus]
MAKVKHNNFLDTVDEVITSATQEGVLHLKAQGEHLNGRKIIINDRESFHFGTTGYLGLEQDARLKAAAINAIQKYGTQFPLSKTYISHPLYAPLEEKIHSMYNHPILITKNSTLGHLAVIPTAVRDGDAIILDHQVHWSVQSATEVLKSRGIPVRMIRHNNMDMLERYIIEFRNKVDKIWYMADGVYSMYGDFAPLKDLMDLSKKYPQLHLYIDDVHGMSWKGRNGTGYVMSVLKDIPENMLLFGTLSKTFGASGAVLVCPDVKLHKKIKNFGGPLTFSAQLEPASVAAATASADIHLSPEIYELQEDLQLKIGYFNELLEKTDLPLVHQNTSPVFYMGTGLPATGYNFVSKLMKAGFFVNLGLFPAVPVKNTGVRITISRHNELEDIKALVDAMSLYLPKALKETHNDLPKIHQSFGMETEKRKAAKPNEKEEGLSLGYKNTIEQVDKREWNACFGGLGTFDWEGLSFLESVFTNNELKEHNWAFHYIIIKDKSRNIVLAAPLTSGILKSDMLSNAHTSRAIEEIRKEDPYYMTDIVLSLGSVFSEGEHLYVDSNHPLQEKAIRLFLEKVEEIKNRVKAKIVILRDFDKENSLHSFFHDQGFIPIDMPDSCEISELNWKDEENYIETLSKRSRKHFRKEVKAFENSFKVTILQHPKPEEIDYHYGLFEQVWQHNLGINTFKFPKKLFHTMATNPNWEFLVLKLNKLEMETNDRPVGVMFCYRSGDTYVPSLVGMDYTYNEKFNTYRQLLYQTIKRAGKSQFTHINFGLSASFEKRKLGATLIPKVAYIQADDNFSLEAMDWIRAD